MAAAEMRTADLQDSAELKTAGSGAQSLHEKPKTEEEEGAQIQAETETRAEETGENGEEEVGECPFCAFMKGGGCRDEFIAWEKCVEDSENQNEDVAEKCWDITTKLRECMAKFSDYYEPILQIEKTMEEDQKKDADASSSAAAAAASGQSSK